MQQNYRTGVKTGLIFLLLFGLWNAPLIATLLRPTMIQLSLEPHLNLYSVSTTSASPSISYPRLGVTAPLTINPQTSPMKSSDWDTIRRAPTQGVSLAFTTETFTQAPLAFVTGHSSDTTRHPYSTVFASLGQAKIDDTFYLAPGNGKQLTYTVKSVERFDPKDIGRFHALSPTSGDTPQRVALVTCWPLLTTWKRLVVLGELTPEFGPPTPFIGPMFPEEPNLQITFDNTE